VIEGKKFSGNAQCRYKDRLLHHGTLLFASRIFDISAALRVDPPNLKERASIGAKAGNEYSEHLKPFDPFGV
jgi:lipoate-protein ligase A